MAGGGNTNTVQEAEPWAGLQPHLLSGYQQAGDIYSNNPSQFYPGQTYLPMNSMQQQALDMQLGNVSQLQNMGGAAQQGLGTMLGASDLQNNPYALQYMGAVNQGLQGNLDTTINRLQQGFTEQALPAIQSGAVGAGQVGSSRQGVAEGIATRGFGQAMTDAARNMTDAANLNMAQFMSDQYGQGLDAVGRGLSMAPTTAAMTQMPYQSLGEVGNTIQQQNMMPLQQAMDQYYYNQQAPWNDLGSYVGSINALPGGFGTTSTSSGAEGSALGGAIGGGMTGYALGSMIPAGTAAGGAAGGATAGSTYGPWGALAGAMLGAMMN